MSKLAKTVMKDNGYHAFNTFSCIVQTDDKNYYYLDSRDTFGFGYETMAFTSNVHGDVTSWEGVYREQFSSREEMEQRHLYLIEHLEEVL